MAMADYYLCDRCNAKCFYDAEVGSYEEDANGKTHYLIGGRRVEIAAICEVCAETHKCVVVSRVTKHDAKEGQ